MGQMKTLKRVLRYIRHYLGLVSLSIALAALGDAPPPAERDLTERREQTGLR